MKKITQEWIKKAEGDWKVALRESNYEEPEYDIVCFHVHQCREFLPALIDKKEDGERAIEMGKEIRKIIRNYFQLEASNENN